MKIMVSGAGAVLGQAIIKSIKASKLKASIIAVDPSPLAAGLYWVDQHYIVPMANDAEYITKIYEILDIERPDIIMIGTDIELTVFARAGEKIEREYGTKVLVSPENVIEIADDKWLTYKFLKENHLEYPESRLPGEEQALIEKVGFPLIVKPRVGARSVGVTKVNDHKELYAALEIVNNPIIQECVGTDDEEYTAGVVVFDNAAKSSIVMKRDLRDGNTSRACAEPYTEINDYLEKVAVKLGVYGPVNFQFRISGDKVKIFEINARFSGTTHFRTLSNVNEVEMCADYLLNHKEIRQPEIKPIQILRYYEETVIPK
ncbi:ATP-grasp domain-containing protein [Alkalibacterium sp. f15]|uniref:ATP-grasp domain-containing protein n=1 Tax=Alkalibacterium sp. f15 TaxID=3414029 RepID=UPI003BF81DF6